MQLTLGKEYRCKYTGQILEFMGWFEKDKTPYVRNNYNPKFNKDGQRTWRLSDLVETTQDEINNYRNYLHNFIEIGEISLSIDKEGKSFLFMENGCSSIEKSDLEKALHFLNEGYQEKYK